MLKVLYISFFIFSQGLGFSFLNSSAVECDKIVLKEVISTEAARAKIEIMVTGGQSPYKYVFSRQSGELISEDFTSNTVKGLEKGQYFCTVVDKKYCKGTLEIEIK